MSEETRMQVNNDHSQSSVIGELVRGVAPENIPTIIEDYVRRIIESAPVLDDKKSNRDGGLMQFKIPSDLHLMPLVEREMYKQFRALDQQNGKIQIDPELIAPLDPELPKILSMYYPNEEIRVETTFDHELRHYFEVEDSKRGNVIAFQLGKVKMHGRKMQLVMIGAGVNYHRPPSSLIEDMDTALGPLYPSKYDITNAQRAANTLAMLTDSDGKRSYAVNVLRKLPEMETAEQHDAKITRAWVDYTWHDGEELARMRGEQVRPTKRSWRSFFGLD